MPMPPRLWASSINRAECDRIGHVVQLELTAANDFSDSKLHELVLQRLGPSDENERYYEWHQRQSFRYYRNLRRFEGEGSVPWVDLQEKVRKTWRRRECRNKLRLMSRAPLMPFVRVKSPLAAEVRTQDVVVRDSAKVGFRQHDFFEAEEARKEARKCRHSDLDYVQAAEGGEKQDRKRLLLRSLAGRQGSEDPLLSPGGVDQDWGDPLTIHRSQEWGEPLLKPPADNQGWRECGGLPFDNPTDDQAWEECGKLPFDDPTDNQGWEEAPFPLTLHCAGNQRSGGW